jgi:hypothetical protein
MLSHLKIRLKAIDLYLAKRQKLMVVFVALAALLALISLLTQPQGAIVLYQTF